MSNNNTFTENLSPQSIGKYTLSVFPEEQVDIREQDNKISVVIWWKKITISNEANQSREITDLYCKLLFVVTSSGICLDELRPYAFYRASASIDEIVSGYMHSHMHSVDYTNCYSEAYRGNAACFGTGPLSKIFSSPSRIFTNIYYLNLLHELDRYVRIESLSGGPYIRMGNIQNYKYAYREYYYKKIEGRLEGIENIDILAQVIKIINAKVIPRIPVYITELGYLPSYGDSKLYCFCSKLLLEALQETFAHDYNNYLKYFYLFFGPTTIKQKSVNYGILKKRDAYYSNVEGTELKLKFKNKDIYFKILQPQQQKERVNNLGMLPELFPIIKNLLYLYHQNGN